MRKIVPARTQGCMGRRKSIEVGWELVLGSFSGPVKEEIRGATGDNE